MHSRAYRLLVVFGRWFEPLTIDETAVAARSFGRIYHVAPELAKWLWEELQIAERAELKQYRAKKIEQRLEETCS